MLGLLMKKKNKKMKPMVKNFWLGKTPMWINFWILGLVFPKLYFLGVLMVLTEFGVGLSFSFANFIAIHSLIPLYLIWGIPTWRSAQIYKGKKLWSSLTQLFVIFKCGSAVLDIFFKDFVLYMFP